MQSTHKISGDAATGFAAYLTSTSSRGDYYSEGDQGESGPGRWHGSPRALGALGLTPGGPVERDALVALMRGVSPASGEPIRPVGAGGTRVAGIDMTFSAPKSVSALWAVSGPYRRAQIEVAHRAAVASALERTEREVAVVRRRIDGVVRWEHAESLVAAEFVHTASRLTRDQERGGVPDPQLHSHLVVLAAERTDGRFAAVDSRELFRAARVNGAWYRAELAWRLGELGLEVHGRAGRDGKYFELAGVPGELARRWSARTVEIDAAAARFHSRYGRDPRGGELGALTVATRGTKTLATQVDVDAAWRAVGEEYGLSSNRAQELFADRPRHEDRALDAELLKGVTRERSVVERRELEAQALELAAGAARPQETPQVIDGLQRAGELVELEGGRWTTRELRELEQATLASVHDRAGEQPARVGDESRGEAVRATERQLGAVLTAEQRDAVSALTGRGGVAVLVGEAGTGKGVVIDAARRAWEREGHHVVGTAVAGATAKRLSADSGIEHALSTDALLHRHGAGDVRLDDRTVVVFDEAGMADTRRLAALTDVTARSGAKLVLVGDGAQLSPIGAGGLFDRVREEAPSARLTEVRRAREPWERDAWAQLRSGDAAPALGAYQARGRLHIAETRQDAVERMVGDWDRARIEYPAGRTVMVTDASNHELDRINALAQQRRLANSELGFERVEIPGRGYGVHAGDEVMLAGQVRPPGRERVENGTRARVLRASQNDNTVTLRTAERSPREIEVGHEDVGQVRLAYAQHVYKAQGMTVDRALVLTGGWQSDRERAYVALSRARERTDVYASREDLGEDGLDAGAIQRLGERMSVSRAQQPSIDHAVVRDRERDLSGSAGGRESEVGRILREQLERERDAERGLGIE